MADQPNPNISTPGKETASPNTVNYNISIGGDVGVGSSIGFGSVSADQIAGNDIVINGMNIDNQGQKFADLLGDLKDLLLKAKETGELIEPAANEVIKQIDSAKDLIEKEKNPPKDTLIEKLHRVMETIDDALEGLNRSHAPAVMLLKALPFVAMLIKLASQIF